MILYDQMIQIISTFRRICLERYADDIDMISPIKRSERLGLKNGNILRELFPEVNQPNDDICRLTKTPRLLKMVLRRTFYAWESLHGELDFDDLLIANVIRFSAPEAFNFILDNIQEIRALRFNLKYPVDSNERLKAIEAKWVRISENANWDVTSTKQLIKFLFPFWGETYNSNSELPLQRLYVSSPADYWFRFLTEELSEDEIKDQEVIRSILSWKDDRAGLHFRGFSLPEILCNNLEFSGKFEFFANSFLNGTELRELASALFAKAIVLHGVVTSADIAPGFISLWRRVIQRPIEENQHSLWVLDEVTKALPKSFRFANDIYYYYSSNCESDIHKAHHHINLRNQIISKTKDIFIGNPKKLMQSIDQKYMYISYHFCVLFSEPEQGGSGFQPEEWKWFAKLLLEAGSLDPQTIVPQIVDLLAEEQSQVLNFTYNFNWPLTEKLFGGEELYLMRLLSTEIDLHYFDSNEIARIECVKKVAEEWLEQQETEPQRDKGDRIF